MPLTGQAKTDYQREYMRRRRSNNRSNIRVDTVRPVTVYPVRPKEQVQPPTKPRPPGLSDNQWAYIQSRE